MTHLRKYVTLLFIIGMCINGLTSQEVCQKPSFFYEMNKPGPRQWLIGEFLRNNKATPSVKSNQESRLGFVHAFSASIYIIIISELGDRTFFISAIMAIRNSRVTVYAGAMCAVGSMTILSALMGLATTIVPRNLTYYASGLLFALFGLKMLKEAYDMSPDEGEEEFEEVQADLRKREEDYLKEGQETGIIRTPRRNFLYSIFSKVFIEAFVLNFLAEWGDRSQITTIILAATKDVVGVIIGCIVGHSLCTGLAVIAGRFVAQKIPIRWLTAIGGVTFMAFAVSTLIIGPDSNS